MNNPIISNICKFKDCDSISVIQGYCNYHYNIINKQQQNDIFKTILIKLNDMDERLTAIEENRRYENSNSVVQNKSKNQIKKKESFENTFIPTIREINSTNINIVDIKETKEDKNISVLTDKLKQTY